MDARLEFSASLAPERNGHKKQWEHIIIARQFLCLTLYPDLRIRCRLYKHKHYKYEYEIKLLNSFSGITQRMFSLLQVCRSTSSKVFLQLICSDENILHSGQILEWPLHKFFASTGRLQYVVLVRKYSCRVETMRCTVVMM